MSNKKCKHLNFSAGVTIERIGDTGKYLSELAIHCAECGMPMVFQGLPAGLVRDGAATSVDGQIARLHILPADECMSTLDHFVAATNTKH